jgi:hypothetical protein
LNDDSTVTSAPERRRTIMAKKAKKAAKAKKKGK